MFGIHHFWLFLASGLLLNLTPGPDTLYILGRSAAQGRRAGIESAFGITAGTVCHTIMAALGLSALLATTAWAFIAIKWLGAAYLIFLGVRTLFQPASAPQESVGVPSRLGAFRQGMLTNILNPKVGLFFLAFLPQFIDPATPTKIPAFLVLGFTFLVTGTIWCLVLAWFAAAFSAGLRRNESIGKILHRAVGSLFIFLGLRLALTR